MALWWACQDLHLGPHPSQVCSGLCVQAARARDGQLVSGMAVTLVVRSIPTVPVRCGRRVARPARTNPARTCRRRSPACVQGRAGPGRPSASWQGPLARGRLLWTLSRVHPIGVMPPRACWGVVKAGGCGGVPGARWGRDSLEGVTRFGGDPTANRGWLGEGGMREGGAVGRLTGQARSRGWAAVGGGQQPQELVPVLGR